MTNLRATNVTATEVDLAWDDNSTDETGFELWRFTAGISTPLIRTVGPDVSTFQDLLVQPNTTYTYVVRAFNGFIGAIVFLNTRLKEPCVCTPWQPPVGSRVPKRRVGAHSFETREELAYISLVQEDVSVVGFGLGIE